MKYLLTLMITLSMLAGPVQAEGLADLAYLQDEWAHIRYEVPADQREKAFARLAQSARQSLLEHPGSAKYQTWLGIILSTYAGEKGGLGALSLVKEARQLFEQAVEQNPQVLSGSALTSLGSLYYQVPGWPISFGDDDKARDYLERGLAVNPDGIDSNFFYADFLVQQHDYQAAKQMLHKALQARARAGRALADEGRRAEIRTLLQTIEQNTHG